MIMVDSGRKAMASQFLDGVIHLAWGTDNSIVPWPPVEVDVARTELHDEIGRRKSSLVSFVEVDAAGIIGVDGESYSLTETPTNLLYMKFIHDVLEGGTEFISQLGIFLNTEQTPADTQFYLEPGDITDIGELFLVENLETFQLSEVKKEIWEFVITF